MNIPAIVAALPAFAFPSLGTVQQSVGLATDNNEANYLYEDIIGLEGLKCRIWPIRAKDGMKIFQAWPSASHNILTPGNPAIVMGYIWADDDTSIKYKILNVETQGDGATTRLITERMP